MSDYTVTAIPKIVVYFHTTRIEFSVRLADGLTTAEIHQTAADIIRRIQGEAVEFPPADPDAAAAEQRGAERATGQIAAWLRSIEPTSVIAESIERGEHLRGDDE